MSLKEAFVNYSGKRVKSFASLSISERLKIASQDGLIESIKTLRELLGRSKEDNAGMLSRDKLYCEQLRGEFLMRRLK